MMLTLFSYYMVAFLLPRLITHWKEDNGTENRNYLILPLLLELLLLIPLMQWSSFYLFLLFIVFYHVLQYAMRRIIANLYVVRILEFFFLLTAAGFLLGAFSDRIVFNSALLDILTKIIRAHVLLSIYAEIDWRNFFIILFGVLVLINEMNTVVRFILHLIKTEPMLNEKTADTQELGRGKISGMISGPWWVCHCTCASSIPMGVLSNMVLNDHIPLCVVLHEPIAGFVVVHIRPPNSFYYLPRLIPIHF